MRELEGPREAANRTAGAESTRQAKRQTGYPPANRTAGAKDPQQASRGAGEPPASVARARPQRPAAQLHAAFTLL